MSLIVVETGYKNFVTTMNDEMVDIYAINLENEENEASDFQTAVEIDKDMSAWKFEQVGSVSIPIYKVTRKDK